MLNGLNWFMLDGIVGIISLNHLSYCVPLIDTIIKSYNLYMQVLGPLNRLAPKVQTQT